MRRPLFFLLAAALPLLLYARTTAFEFVRADDADLIAGNQPFLTDLANLPRAFTRSYFEVEGDLIEQKTYYRPVAIVSFMLDAARAGADPGAYHLTNIVLHAAVTCLLMQLALTWGAPPLAALAAALVFAVHPVNAQAVAWIAGRNDLLLALFGLVSLLAWSATTEVVALRDGGGATRTATPRSAPTRSATTRSATTRSTTTRSAPTRSATTLVVATTAHALAFALALFSKETGLFFPALAVLHQRLALRVPLTRAQKIALGLDAAIVIGWALLRSRALARMPSDLRADTFRVALVNAPQLLVHAGKMLLPARLNVAPGVDAIGVALGAVAVILAAWAAWRFVPRAPAIVAIAWTLAFLLPTLLVPALPAYEHRAYLPLTGILIIASLPARSRKPHFRLTAEATLIAIVVSGMAIATYERQNVFRNPFTYWTDAALDPQFGALAHVNLGQLHEAEGRLADARRAYLRALERDPNTPKAHNNLGVVLMHLEQPDLALTHFREEARRHPWNADAWFNLGLFEEMRGNTAAARQHYERAIAENRAFTPAYEKLGIPAPQRP